MKNPLLSPEKHQPLPETVRSGCFSLPPFQLPKKRQRTGACCQVSLRAELPARPVVLSASDIQAEKSTLRADVRLASSAKIPITHEAPHDHAMRGLFFSGYPRKAAFILFSAQPRTAAFPVRQDRQSGTGGTTSARNVHRSAMMRLPQSSTSSLLPE